MSFHLLSRISLSSLVIIRRITYSHGLEEKPLVDLYARHMQFYARTGNIRLGKSIHAAIHKNPFLLSSLFLHNHLLNLYFKCRDLSSAHYLFNEMINRNVFTWSTAISGFVHCGRPQLALTCYLLMQQTGLRPNEFTLVGALNACAESEGSVVAYQVYGQVLRLGYEWNVFLVNAFLMAMIRNGNPTDAVKFFERCSEKDVVTWNSMLAASFQTSCFDIWSLVCRMIQEGMRPDEFTFSTVLTGLARSGEFISGLQVHGQLVKCGHVDDMCIGDSLIDFYLRNQEFSKGCKVFEEMPSKDVVSWTHMVSGFFRCGQPSKSLQHLKTMMQMGVRPNKFTLATSFNVCATIVSLEEGKKFHGLRIKLGNEEIDACVDNALIDMYAKCGSMGSASTVFRLIKCQSVISWTTMIMGFAQNGLAKDALRIFEEMISEKIEPNNITFICVLYACSQGGLVDEGWRYFLSMSHDYGVVPEEDHYACMVDLLGRAGLIADAEALIKTMPFQPRTLIWQTLLGACRIHGDVVTGNLAAQKAIAQDSQDHSTYVLLSNMFATSSHWDGVGRVRKLIEERGVVRIQGRSWIEVEDGK